MISKGRIVGETTSFPNDSATFREDKHSGAAAGCKGWDSQPTWRLSPLRGVTEHTDHTACRQPEVLQVRRRHGFNSRRGGHFFSGAT